MGGIGTGGNNISSCGGSGGAVGGDGGGDGESVGLCCGDTRVLGDEGGDDLPDGLGTGGGEIGLFPSSYMRYVQYTLSSARYAHDSRGLSLDATRMISWIFRTDSLLLLWRTPPLFRP